MKQSKKILAALVAVPASVVVADAALAAEETETKVQTLEFSNDFTEKSTYTTQKSSKEISANEVADLKKHILIEMSKYTKGFTINYTGDAVANYKIAIEDTLNKELKGALNTEKTVDTATFDVTELYGTYKNMRVKATETFVDGKINAVKLEFSINYFGTTTNGESKELKDAKAHYEKSLKTKVNAATSDVAKVKIIHDYVIQSTRYVATQHSLNPVSGLSSHGYALWMYTLLKQVEWTTPSQTPEVRYVYGVVGGEYRSWNIIKLDSKWYHLDAASDDTAKSGDTLIKYHHFLTNKPNEKRIDVGGESITVNDSKYNHFLTADNQAQSSTHIYYADAEKSGELFQIYLSTLMPKSLEITKENATSGKGRMLYYEHTSEDTSGVTVVAKKLYFINDSQGKYLYSYDVETKQLDLVLKKQLASISLSGATLLYETLNGEVGNIPLAYLNTFDQERADVVIKAIEKLEDMDKTTAAYKKAVTDARKLYMGLTETQKSLVINIDVLKRLEQEIEKGSSIINVINLINGLDEMSLDYVGKVDEAAKAYKTLSEADKSKVYNHAILKEAEARINEAKVLNQELQEKLSGLVGDESPFEKYPDFIIFMEEFFKKYDNYLPSIRQVFTSSPESILAISTYRAQMVDYRTETQIFINLVKIIDENSKSFLEEMKAIEKQYGELLPSQKFLISGADGDKVLQKLEKANQMREQIKRFNELMSTVTSGDVATIKLTDKLINDMREAQQLFDSMKPAQIEAISQDNIDKLTALIKRINSYTDNEALKTLIGNVSALDIAQMTTLEELIAAVTSVDTASIAVMKDMGMQDEDELFALLSPEIVSKLQQYRTLKYKAVSVGKPVQQKMAELTDDSTKEEIGAARKVYDKLEPAELKALLKEELKNLEKHELRLKNGDIAEKVQSIIDKINALSDTSTFEQVKVVYDEYQALDSELKPLVTNSEKLLDLWKKVSADAEAYQKAIEAVNKAIAALTENSTREEIQKVIDAYNALTEDQKKQVINYDKINELLSKLDEDAKEELAQAAADKVKELILSLTDESSKADIEAARAAYEALSAEAKALITKQVLDVLKYYETRLTELSEQAKKEAAVVVDRINRITSSYTEAQIKNIRLAYNALSQLAKQYVTNLQKLIDAENNILYQNTVVKQAKIDANTFDVYMNDINRKSTTAEIAKARAYYNRLSAEAKKYVTTYEKLVRLETMWKDPEYLDLVFTYYPEYVDQVKPGGIVIEKPEYDPTYIPDDLSGSSSNSNIAINKPTMTWTPYETMSYQNGRYVTKISSTQVQNITDRNMRLKANSIEIVVPTADLKASTATVAVALSVTNNQLNIEFTEGNKQKYFSEYVEIHVPFSVLKGNASQIIERVSATNSSASFKVEGSSFIIRTKSSGTFKTASAFTYNDLPNNAQGTAIHELAKRGILFNTNSRLSQSYKKVTKFDVASMIAKALDVTSTKKSSYQDITNKDNLMLAQGLLEAGIMSGSTSVRFNGEETVTKQEAAIIIANMYRYLNQDLSKAYNTLTSNYFDVANLTFEARQSIAILELFNVVNGSGSFEPTKVLTRGEFAELLYNALTAIDYL